MDEVEYRVEVRHRESHERVESFYLDTMAEAHEKLEALRLEWPWPVWYVDYDVIQKELAT